MHIEIKDINDENQINYLLILIGKIMLVVFPNYERYFINFKHPFSLGGMVSFEKERLKNILYQDEISSMNEVIGKDSTYLIHEIQNTNIDFRSYKFHTFPKMSAENWEISSIEDISVEGIKRFKAKLIITEKNISKKEVENLLFQITKKIRVLENKSNPTTKIKYGKIEADLVRITVFYKVNKRGAFSLLKNNENFICLTHYYKNYSVPKIEVPFQDNYSFEKLKKLDIYWNKRFKSSLVRKHK